MSQDQSSLERTQEQKLELNQELRAQRIAHVDKSPQAVGVHDKSAWLAIFAKYHLVEDPVGSPAHIGGVFDGKAGQRGNGALSRFYDTFIAPNGIRFEVIKDTVNGNHVVRDLTVHTTMSPSLTLGVSMHLLYELCEEEQELKIQRLAAHWELMPMMGQVFSAGLSCLPVLVSLSARMIGNQGLSGVLGFCKAAFTVGNYGKQQLENFCDFVNAKHEMRLKDFLSGLEVVHVSEKELKVDEFIKSDLSIQLKEKILVAGNVVSASFSCVFENHEMSGVLFIEFNKRSKKAAAIRLYCD